MSKFKKGDRVIFRDPRYPQYTTAIVARSPVTSDDNLAVRFDSVNYYGTSTNCHSGWAQDRFELDLTYDSPLCQALR